MEKFLAFMAAVILMIAGYNEYEMLTEYPAGGISNQERQTDENGYVCLGTIKIRDCKYLDQEIANRFGRPDDWLLVDYFDPIKTESGVATIVKIKYFDDSCDYGIVNLV